MIEEAEEEARRLLFMIHYEGPWERLLNVAYGIRPDLTLRWEIPSRPRGVLWVLDKLGQFFDARDRAWRERHLAAGTEPVRWKRRGVR